FRRKEIDLMRFLWYKDNDKENEIVDYKMTVHIFGNTSSPARTSETLQLIKNTRDMLHTANLRLHKIASNSPEVMKLLSPQDKVENLRNLDPSHDPLPQQRSLGVVWNIEKDAFTFQVLLPEKPFTCRVIL
ncbi:Hypothetical predicted protein, partial [Paramuricea clavata]